MLPTIPRSRARSMWISASVPFSTSATRASSGVELMRMMFATSPPLTPRQDPRAPRTGSSGSPDRRAQTTLPPHHRTRKYASFQGKILDRCGGRVLRSRCVMSVLNSKVLVLNRSYLPVHVTSVKRAFVLLYQDIARAVDEQYRTFDFASWSQLAVSVEHDTVGLVSRVVRVPRVILLVAYDRVPKRHVRFSRYNIYARDGNTCQYCGKHFARIDLNLDHVVPRSRGGRGTWENLVCSCHRCNRR